MWTWGKNATKLDTKAPLHKQIKSITSVANKVCVDSGIKLRSAHVAPYFILGVFKVLHILTNHTQFCWA